MFYALRPALALAWLRRIGVPPPMDLASLRAGFAPRPELVQAVTALQARKAIGREADPAPRCPEVEDFVCEVLAVRPERPASWDKTPAIAAADAVLLRLVTGHR